jgi:ribose-phosphate pyrophosphokinase
MAKTPVLLSGSAHPGLCATLARALGLGAPAPCCARFPDREIRVRIETPVRGADVYLLQPLTEPAGESLLELLLIADAARRAGASRITALVPYLAYARQDRRPAEGAAASAGVVLRLLGGAVDRIVTVDIHAPALESASVVPFEAVGAMASLAAAFEKEGERPEVVVAPDRGAVHRAARFAARLSLPSISVHKERLDGSEVRTHAIHGEVAGRRVVIVDDMLSTAGTVVAAAKALEAAGARLPVDVAITHGLFAGPARARLADAPIGRIVVTDTLAPPADLASRVEVVSVAPLLAEVIRRLHENANLGDLIGD